MVTETMNIHQALVELKTLDKRIAKAIQETTWVVANKHSNTKVGGVDAQEYAAEVKARYQKAMDLIRRRDAIKRAVVNSNAVTKVVIAGVEYTVAEAIDRKNTSIEFLNQMSRALAKDYGMAKATADRANGSELERRADEHVRIMIGNSDMKGATAEAQRIREEFIRAQTTELLDPLGALKVIEALDEEVTSFLTNVDAALSVSNAVTTILVEY
jgi:hypothetical protein